MTTTLEHKTQYEELDSLSDWELENSSQDIRGRDLILEDGTKLGVIDDLLVDQSAEEVVAVRLNNEKCVGVEQLEINTDQVVYHSGTEFAGRAAVGSHDEANHTEKHIPIVEEEVAIGKRAVEGGSIRVKSRIVEDEVREDVELRDETVHVETRAVNKPLSTEDADALLTGKTVEVTEHNEEVVVGKKAVVTDEVVVSKDADTVVEEVSETVRRTEVDIDRDAEVKKGTRPTK